jgi:hypothetical protein
MSTDIQGPDLRRDLAGNDGAWLLRQLIRDRLTLDEPTNAAALEQAATGRRRPSPHEHHNPPRRFE